MAVTPLRSRDAITRFKVIEKFEIISELAVQLETGRTHQIRVHLSHIGHPVVGDPTYDGRRNIYNLPENIFLEIMQIMPRQALHAGKLGFEHPITKQEMDFEAPLPLDMQNLYNYLKNLHL